MKVAVGQIVLALVIIGGGAVCLRAGRVAEGIADAQEQLALLRYGSLSGAYGGVEDSVGYARLVPWISDGVLSDVRRQRTAAEYWQARYTTLSVKRDSKGLVLEQDPTLLLVAANAGYRASQRDSATRDDLLHSLDASLKSYADVLKKDPALVDAAYNYEFVSKLRDAMVKVKTAAKPGAAAALVAQATKKTGHAEGAPLMVGDLPDGLTFYGWPGAPPPNADMGQFKLHVPMRPEERKAGEDAGTGGPKQRKG
jgi:hypothetical protein